MRGMPDISPAPPLPDELAQRAISVIARVQRVPIEKISVDSTFEELGMDSLDGVNILFALEEEFNVNIPDEQAKEIRGVRQMVEGIGKLLAAGGEAVKS
jgi:acyl carrier protein